MSEQGNDEQLTELDAMGDVDRRLAEDVEQERAEEARTSSAPMVDDGGSEPDEP